MLTNRIAPYVVGQSKLLIACVPVILLGLFAVSAATVRLFHLPTDETRRANMEVQRIVIDAVTGEVAGLKPKATSTFDVGEAVTPAAPLPETEAPAPSAAVEKPIAEHESEPEETETNTTTHTPETTAEGTELRTQPLVAELAAVARNSKSLVKAPAPEAVEQKGDLILPRKTDKGLTPSRLYARSFAYGEQPQKLLALIITDAGFNADSLTAILNLPPEVSVAVSPYVPESNRIIETLRNNGREAWVMLPAMTDSYPAQDPGPLGLVASQKPEGAIARVQQVLASAIGSVGVVLSPNEAITPSETVWPAVLTEIEGRGLYTLSTRANRSLDQIAPNQEKQASVKRADLILDENLSAAAIRSKLSSLSAEFATKDAMIVIASARPQTLSILSGWLNAQQTFTLAPVSAVFRGIEAPPPPAEEKKKSGGHH